MFTLLILINLIYVHINASNINDNPLVLSELLLDTESRSNFNQFSPCSIAASRLRDAYKLEGQLVEMILSGLERVAQDREDAKSFKLMKESDEDLKKVMTSIFEMRQQENKTRCFSKHPLNAYHFLKRVVLEFNKALDKIFSSQRLMRRPFYQDLRGEVNRHILDDSMCWPTSIDLKISLSGLAALIKVYDLPIKTIMEQGKLTIGEEEKVTYEGLKLVDGIVLLQEANRQSHYKKVIEWSQYLHEKFIKQIDGNEALWRSFVRMRAAALFKTNQADAAISYLEDQTKNTEYNVRGLKTDIQFYQSSKDSESLKQEKQKLQYQSSLDKLCRSGTTYRFTDKRLRCFYKSSLKGWSQNRVEVLSRKPLIFLYQNVVSEEEITEIFDYVKTEKIKRHIYGTRSDFKEYFEERKEFTQMWDEDLPTMLQLAKRIHLATGLKTINYKYNTFESSSGPFGIINYGIGGGSMENITDYLNNKETIFGGDRLATWIYQLSNASKGGNIVFPDAGIAVNLGKGNGLLWFNTFRKGDINPHSVHVECPVVSGSLWVAQKYIYENGNMFNWQCLSKKKSYFF